MSFYDPKTQSLIVQVPSKSGGTRAPTIKDAKENGWFARVTQVTGDIAGAALIAYKIGCGVRTTLENDQKKNEPLDSYVDRMVVLSRRDAQEAADKGTDLHSALLLYEQTQEGTTDPDIAKQLRSWRKWRKKNIKEVLSMEQVGYGPGYAGRYDMNCALVRDLSCLLDYKGQRFDSTPKVYESWGLQNAAYETFLGKRDVWINACFSTTKPGLLVIHEWTQEGMNHYRARWPVEYFRYCFAHRWFPPGAFEFFLESLKEKDQLLAAMKYVGEGRNQKTKVVA